MEDKRWIADPAVLDAVRRFILALIILGLALMGYQVEVTQGEPAGPIPIVATAEPAP